MSRVPRPLFALLVVVAVFGFAWAVLMPPWQSSDERAYFGYVQQLVEARELPDPDPTPGEGNAYSTEQRLAMQRSGAERIASDPRVDPERSQIAYDRWRRAQARLDGADRSDGGGAATGAGPNPARAAPPLSPLASSIAYAAAYRADPITRLVAMRLLALLFLLVAVAASYLLIGEFTRSRLLRLAGAALVGLQPLAGLAGGSANPDSLLLAAFAVALLSAVRIVRRGLDVRRTIWLGASCAIGLTTAAVGFALLSLMAFAFAVGLYRLGPPRVPTVDVLEAPLAFIVPVGAWIAIATLLDRPVIATATAPGRAAVPDALDPGPVAGSAVVVVLVAIAIGGGWAAVRVARRGERWVVALLAFVAAVVVLRLELAGIGVTEGAEPPLERARRLLVLTPLLGLAAAGGLGLLGGRTRGVAVAVLLTALVVAQVVALATVAGRFYA